MKVELNGVAFITGAGSGIGASTAYKFAQCGIYGLSLVDINVSAIDSLIPKIAEDFPDVIFFVQHIDVADESSVETAVQNTVAKFGHIDIAIHAAGIGDSGKPTHELSLEIWQRMIDINQTGLWLCERAVIRQMLQQQSGGKRLGRGVIVNVSSSLGQAAASHAFFPSYTAAKHAVMGFTKMDAKTYAADEIRINAVCPGWTRTPMIEDNIEDPLMKQEIGSAASRRVGEVDEVVDTILFLASPMSSFIYGAGLVVDGGYNL